MSKLCASFPNFLRSSQCLVILHHGPFTTKQVCSFFFLPVLDSQGEETERFRCRCGTVRKQAHRTGYSNLIGHVQREHAGTIATMEAAVADTETSVQFMVSADPRLDRLCCLMQHAIRDH